MDFISPDFFPKRRVGKLVSSPQALWAPSFAVFLFLLQLGSSKVGPSGKPVTKNRGTHFFLLKTGGEQKTQGNLFIYLWGPFIGVIL